LFCIVSFCFVSACAPGPLEQARRNQSEQAANYAAELAEPGSLQAAFAQSAQLCENFSPDDPQLRRLGPGRSIVLMEEKRARALLAREAQRELLARLRLYRADRLPLRADAADRAADSDVVQLLQATPRYGRNVYRLISDAALASDAPEGDAATLAANELCSLLQPDAEDARIFERALASGKAIAGDLQRDALGIYLTAVAPVLNGEANATSAALLVRKHDASALQAGDPERASRE